MFLKFKTSDKILQNYRYTLHELSDIQTEDENGVFTYSMDEGYEHVEVSNQSSIPNYIGEIEELFPAYVCSKPVVGDHYHLKWNAKEQDVVIGTDAEGEDIIIKSNLVPDESGLETCKLAEEWTQIRAERDRLLTSSDWTQGADSPLASAKVTEWGTYRTKLRTLPEDQKAKTTYADITWPTQPS